MVNNMLTKRSIHTIVLSLQVAHWVQTTA